MDSGGLEALEALVKLARASPKEAAQAVGADLEPEQLRALASALIEIAVAYEAGEPRETKEIRWHFPKAE